MNRVLSEEEKQRRDKVQSYRAQGINPYRNDLRPSHTAAQIAAHWGELSREQLEGGEPITVAIAGRIMAFRHFGKASFITLKDRSGKIQSYVGLDRIGEKQFQLFKTFDIGDFVYAKGSLFRTKTGELSIMANTVELLTKSLRPLPEKFHGLTDVEQKYRMRYVDLIMNDDTRAVFEKRSRIVSLMRTFLMQKDFLEVETPMMHPIAGGAAARPFKTHHNTLGMDLFLRIAPELYLKRLVVGGIEKVFEINRNFRNEGISVRHNPEFTMLEFYWAYATYEDLMNLTEEMIASLCKEVCGSLKISYQGTIIDFTPPWKRLTMKEAVRMHAGLPEELTTDEALSNIQTLKKALKVCGISVDEIYKNAGPGFLLNKIFEEKVEAKMIQPTFITEFPTEVSFLSRRNDTNPAIVDRFELMVYGREIANAFSELNDPIDQRERFEGQAQAKAAGDEEACDVDEDFLRALEYGMPPTAGEGIGIDRLTMLLTDQASIRDVILFPHMRPENL